MRESAWVPLAQAHAERVAPWVGGRLARRPRGEKNAIEGVTKGYERSLDIVGVGFKAEAKASSIFLSLGFANAKEYKIPDGAKVTIQNQGVRILVLAAQ